MKLKATTTHVTYFDTLCEGWTLDMEHDSLGEAEAEVEDYDRAMEHGGSEGGDLLICEAEDFIENRKAIWNGSGIVIEGTKPERETE